jgi:DNA-binding FrmR family transcriptional regulator
MAHTIDNKEKLVARVRRIRGQINSIEKALEDDQECSAILNTVVSCRGALSGLMSELIEDHVRFHVVDPSRKIGTHQREAVEQLIGVIKTYLR